MESNTTAIEFIIYALIIAATVVMFAVTLTAQPAAHVPGNKLPLRPGNRRRWAFLLLQARSALLYSPLFRIKRPHA